MDETEWTGYWQTIFDYRNQMAAHNDLAADLKRYPHFDSALVAADFMYECLLTHLPEDESGGIPSSLDGWSNTVQGNMGAIVRAAFAAARQLGSNMPRRQ